MSVRYKIISTAIRLSGYKKSFELSESELLAKAEKFNKNRNLHLPKDKKYRYGVPYKLHIGKGMCHCYPMVRFFPEGRRANDEITELLK